MEVTVKIINAFSIGGTGGNPAGVVFNADDLGRDQKQNIAAKVGLPETAFVSSSAIADFKLDFFTPVKQIAHCGHATIATFTFLRQTGKITTNESSKETIDGTRRILFKNGLAFMEQRAPVIEFIDDQVPAILESLQIDKNALAEGKKPAIVDTGNKFLIIPIKDPEIIKDINYNSDAVFQLSNNFGLIGYYLYSTAGIIKDIDATTRMFAPFYGIQEEAATGMAAGPLASYLHQLEKIDKSSFKIEQGRYMKTPSISQIEVALELSKGIIKRLFAGGDAFISGEKIIEI